MRDFQILRHANQSQIGHAYGLAQETFGWTTTLQRDPLDFDASRDLITVILGDEVVGVLRLLPRPFRIGSRVINSGLVDAVAVKERYRGTGVGRLLIEECQRVGRATGYESLHLFARRAVDGFYTKFNFWGTSSFFEVNILSDFSSRCEPHSAQKRFATVDDIEFLSSCFEFAYQNAAGPYLRDERRWKAIIDSDEMPIKILVLIVGQTRVGYVAAEKSVVVEVGFIPNFSGANLKFIVDNGYSQLRISPEHEILREAAQPSLLDVRVSYRSCHYGGHMICLLGPSNTRNNGPAGFQRLIESLGVQSQVIGPQFGERAFNFGRLDELIT